MKSFNNYESYLNAGARGHLFPHCAKAATVALAALIAALIPLKLNADVPHGTAEGATNYYKAFSGTSGFSTPDQIFQTTLDDVADYMGFHGFSGADLQNLPPDVLMHPEKSLSVSSGPATRGVFQNNNALQNTFSLSPLLADEILVTRFFAPKIMDVSQPQATRKLGWRKLVRFHARHGSVAESHHIASCVILFNFFTDPSVIPFSLGIESLNTQVILLPEAGSVAPPNGEGLDALYWLDYDVLSKGGKLSTALNQSFDANELPKENKGIQPYYVPDGCVACHGITKPASLLNYLDTDEWFDRIENDFTNVKTNGYAILFDAQTNDPTSPAFKAAFDTIRKFNTEADEQVSRTQPTHDEALASHKWLEVHASNYAHVFPVDRAIGPEVKWSNQNTNDAKALDTFNQYCFRCHGTVKFSVFNRHAILDTQTRGIALQALQTNAVFGVRMPTDRELPDDARSIMLNFIRQK